MEQKNQKTLRITAAVFSGILLVALLLAFLYIRSLYRTFYLETTSYLSEIADQSVDALQKQIDGDIKILENMALMIDGEPDLWAQPVMDLLRRAGARNNYKRMGIIYPDGSAYTTDEQHMDLADRAYFQQALQGNPAVSNTLRDKIGGSDIYVYAVPIYAGDETVRAVLFATHSDESFQNILSVHILQGQGYSYIAAADGACVVGSSHPDAISVLDNVLDYWLEKAEENEKPVEQIHTDMLAGKSGCIRVVVGAEAKYAGYAPVGVNDWYLITIVPESVVSNRAELIMRITLGLCVAIILALAGLLLSIIRAQRRSARALEQIAYEDSVTHGDNYPRFLLRVRSVMAHEEKQPRAVVQFDLLRFRLVNDRFGYTLGNELLRELAAQVQTQLGQGEFLAHISGDRFVMLLFYTSKDSLSERLSALCEGLSRVPRRLGMMDCSIRPVMGVYLVEDRSMEAAAMTDHANLARMEAKERGDTAVLFYDEPLRQRLILEKELANELETALQHNMFSIAYQPWVAVASGRIAGAEALVRWQHPTRGLLLPADFLPLAERGGLLLRIDLYVLDRVCAHLRRRLDRGEKPVRVSVNISRLHLQQTDFVASLRNILTRYAIPDGLITLELKESAMYENSERLPKLIGELHRAGLRLAADGFGNGYSSLNILKDIPVDEIKIARGFFESEVMGERDGKIVQMIVSLARKLGVQVIAQGIETQAQASFLHNVSCAFAQGYYYARPMDEEAFDLLCEKE